MQQLLEFVHYEHFDYYTNKATINKAKKVITNFTTIAKGTVTKFTAFTSIPASTTYAAAATNATNEAITDVRTATALQSTTKTTASTSKLNPQNASTEFFGNAPTQIKILKTPNRNVITPRRTS